MPEQGRFCPTFNGHLAKVTFLHHYTTVPLTISWTRLLPYSAIVAPRSTVCVGF